MELIAAVYDNWGIGNAGTQPIALRADRKFFREMTADATVIVGRKTAADFPGGRPLPGRRNILLSRRNIEMPGFIVCSDPAQALEQTKDAQRVMVIGGGNVYRQMLPLCDRAYITKIHCTPHCDTFLPNLDESAQWVCVQRLCAGTEDEIEYEMYRYDRIEKMTEETTHA